MVELLQTLFLPAPCWTGWLIAIPFALAIVVLLIGGAKWAGYLSPLDFTHGLTASDKGFLESAFEIYWLWGTLQQILCCAVFLGLRHIMPTELAIIITAMLFGALHSPNILLVFACTGMGFLYMTHFSHWHNLYLIGFLHGLFATTLKYFWPFEVTHNLKIWSAYK